MSVCPSVRPSVLMEQLGFKFDIRVLLESMSRKLKFRSNLTTITDTLREDALTFIIITR
jgi:hypothetical protein